MFKNRFEFRTVCWMLALAAAALEIGQCQQVQRNSIEEQIVQQALSAPRQSMLNVGILNGIAYASQFGTGQNSIANALQHAETVVVDPAYGGRERYGSRNLPAATSSSPVHLIDYRYGMQADQFANWSSGEFTVYPALLQRPAAAHYTSCSMNYLSGVSATNGTTCIGIALSESAPGYSIGNPAVPPGSIPSGAPWSVGAALSPTMISYTSGIMGATGGLVTHTAPGDTINYFYAYSNNGSTAASDEGVKALAADTAEMNSPYLGTLTSSAAKGARTIQTKSLGAGIQGQGQYIIDRDDRGKVSGHILQVGRGVVAPVNAVTIDQQVEPSNAWGTLVANVAPPIVLTGDTFATPQTVSVKVLSGTFNTSALLCLASQFHECAIPTSVTVSGGLATLTIPLRVPHAAGALVMQGGMAGTGLEIATDTVSMGSQTLRYLQDVFGSTDGHTLQVGTFLNGSVSGLAFGTLSLGSVKLANVTSSGPTVTALIANNGSLWYPQRFTGSTFKLADTGDPALEMPCTGLAFDTKGEFSCKIQGLNGVHHAKDGTASLGNNSFNLWPMAETLDVQSYANNPVQVDGTFVLEPNVINFSPNDVIEQTHNRAATYAAITTDLGVQDPYVNLDGASFTFWGYGIQAPPGGGRGLSYPTLGKFLNMNPASMYEGSGGNAWPPNILNLGGFKGAPYSNGINAYPGPLRAFIEVSPSAIQMNDPNYHLNLLQVVSLHGLFQLSTTPSSNSLSITQAGGPVSVVADGSLTLHGATVAVQGPLTATSGLTTGSIVDTGLTPGQCVQATAGGLLKSTGAPCGSASPGAGSGFSPMRFVGTISTTSGTHDLLAVPGITSSSHCFAQATDQQAAGMPEFLTVVGASGLVLNHSNVVSGATFDIFCNVP
jgi:hypothetical protein